MNPPLGTTLLPDAVPVAPASVDPAPVPGSVGHRLAAEGLALAYGDRTVVSDLDLQIRTGAITTIPVRKLALSPAKRPGRLGVSSAIWNRLGLILGRLGAELARLRVSASSFTHVSHI